jgi:hypothetical protein
MLVYPLALSACSGLDAFVVGKAIHPSNQRWLKAYLCLYLRRNHLRAFHE